jgi:hypothetical protein
VRRRRSSTVDDDACDARDGMRATVIDGDVDVDGVSVIVGGANAARTRGRREATTARGANALCDDDDEGDGVR